MRSGLVIFVIVIAGFLTGCGRSGSPVSQSTGGYISLENGRVTGQIAPIDVKLEVRAVKTRDVGSTHATEFKEDHTSAPKKEWHHNRWDINAGGVRIELEQTGEEPIALRIDGNDYGVITKGDALLIDDQGRVLVSGVLREQRDPQTTDRVPR